MKNSISRPVFYGTILFFFLIQLIVLFSNLKFLSHGFISFADMSIYQQAILKIADGQSLNPYISIRNLNILNDHFDPIIYLAAIFIKIFGEAPSNFIIFEWLFWPLTAIAAFIFAKNEKFSDLEILFAIGMITFCRGALQGVEFPIHPTTWSMLFAFCFTYYFFKENVLAMILWSIPMVLSREIYYFSIVGISFYYLLNKRWLHFFIFLFFGICLLFILFKLRPYFLGPVVQYDNDTLTALKNGNISGFFANLRSYTWPWREFIIPIIGLYLFKNSIPKNLRELRESKVLGLFSFILPGILIHWIVGRMVHHQSIPFTIPFTALLVFSPLLVQNKVSQKFIIALLCGSAFVSINPIKKKVIFLFSETKNEINLKEKLISIKKFQEIFRQIDPDSSILVSGSIPVLNLKSSYSKIYIIASETPYPDGINYIALEKAYTGDSFPINNQELTKLAERCSPVASQTLFEDRFFIILKGPFTPECIEWSSIFPKKEKYLLPIDKYPQYPN